MKETIQTRFKKKAGTILGILTFLFAIVSPSLMPDGTVNAAGQLTNRSISLASSSLGNVTTDINGNNGTAGGYYNGSQTTHTITFKTATAGAIQSLAVMYCSTASGGGPLPQTACAAPTGLNAANITGITTSGFGANTWVRDTSTAGNTGYFSTGQCSGGAAPYRQNCVLFTQSTASSTAANSTVTINIGSAGGGWMTNPTATGNYYVRVALFTDTGYSAVNDQGSMAFSVNAPIEIDSAVQETLAFSVSPTFSSRGTGSQCNALGGGGAVNLGNNASGGTYYVVDTSGPYTANSYWRLASNATNGIKVAYSGGTLKSGTNAFSSSSSGVVNPAAGTEFFGLTDDTANGNNSMTNTTTVSPYTSTTTYALNADTATATNIASAASGTAVACDTGAIKYGAGAATTTKAGIYKTNFVYYAIPTY